LIAKRSKAQSIHTTGTGGSLAAKPKTTT